VQSELQLYQTNLLLLAAPEESGAWQKNLLGETPYLSARQQYQSALENLETYQGKVQGRLQTLPAEEEAQSLRRVLRDNQANLDQLTLNLGLLEVQQSAVPNALEHWRGLLTQGNLDPSLAQTAQTLIALWEDPPRTAPETEAILEQNLKGWFQNQALQRFYSLRGETDKLQVLTEKEQSQARQALLKLALLGGLPVIGGIFGTLLLLGLFGQWFLKREESLLTKPHREPWQTPWDGEIIWQVLILGFLFIGQVLLPLIISLLPLDLSQLGLGGKALYVFASYLLLASAGLGVLFFSLKPYFPLPPDWFRVKLNFPALGWGLGGYWVALPLVVLVSLVNETLWGGQGGSNPLLSLALEARDWGALTLFWLTAAVLAPIFEETLFRGFLLPSLTRYLPLPAAVALSSLGFAVAHLNLSEILPLAMLGVILGTVYSRSRNLLASMVTHGLWNSGTLLSLFLLGS
jgi:membrane protease YdiL (CAAX protease family)